MEDNSSIPFHSLVAEFGSADAALSVLCLSHEPLAPALAPLVTLEQRLSKLAADSFSGLSGLTTATTAVAADRRLWAPHCVNTESTEQAAAFQSELSLSNFSLVWSPHNT